MSIFKKNKKNKKTVSSKRIKADKTPVTINAPKPSPVVIKKTKPRWQKEIDVRGDSASVWNTSDAPKDIAEVRAYYLKSKEKKRGGVVKDSWSNRANQKD